MTLTVDRDFFRRAAAHYRTQDALPNQTAMWGRMAEILTPLEIGELESLWRADPEEEANDGNGDYPLVLGSGSKYIPATHRDVDWTDFNCPVSKHFTVGEVTNRERIRIPTTTEVKVNIMTLAKELDEVRAAWGSAILTTSWYRPPMVNVRVGGAKFSQHLTGRAVDVRPVNGELARFQEWLDKKAWKDMALGYGARRGFVHLDLRPGRIRWNY